MGWVDRLFNKNTIAAMAALTMFGCDRPEEMKVNEENFKRQTKAYGSISMGELEKGGNIQVPKPVYNLFESNRRQGKDKITEEDIRELNKRYKWNFVFEITTQASLFGPGSKPYGYYPQHIECLKGIESLNTVLPLIEQNRESKSNKR